MRARSRRIVWTVIVVMLMSAAFSVAVSPRTPEGIITGILAGSSIGVLLATAEIFLRTRWAGTIRRLPVALVFLLRTIFYGLVLVGVPRAIIAVVVSALPVASGEVRPNEPPSLLVVAAFATAMNVAFTLRALLGSSVLISLVTGRYHRPREEERVLLFMDLRGSTHLAEALGDKNFHRFLNQTFFDVTDPVLEAGGEIYRYVGDEIIITWQADRGARDAACVTCAFDIEDTLARRRDRYLAEFGVEPHFRGALHAGPLIVGEMGEIKREIVMLGDTMNTTARIEGVCRATSRNIIASAVLLSKLPSLPRGVHAESLGSITLAGKASEIELFALERD